MLKKTAINKLIEKNSNFYILTFISLIFSFLFFDIGVISIYNIYQQNKTLEISYSLSTNINNNVSQISIENIEKRILKIKGIETVKYIDKYIALNQLALKLGISTKKMSNPLFNSFRIKIRGEDALKNAFNIINDINGVKNVVINKEAITQLNQKISRNKKIIIWLFFIILIPIKIIIFNLMHGTVVSQNHDIKMKLSDGTKMKDILKPYYVINNIKFISSAVVGSLIFLNIYEFIRNELIKSIYLVGIVEVSLIIGTIIVLVSLIFPFISIRSIKNKR